MTSKVFSTLNCLLILTTVGLLSASLAFPSAIQEFKGKGRVKYQSRKPKPPDIEKAVEKARFNALDAYVSNLSESQANNFYDLEDEILDNLDDYVPNFRKIDSATDKDSKTYTVLIMAEVHTVKLERLLRKSAGGAGGGWQGEEAYIAFVFTARNKSEVQSFDDRRLTRRDTDVTNDASETLAGDSRSAVSGTSKKSSTIEITGGSTTRKADNASFDSGSAQEIQGIVKGVFNAAKFKVIDSAETGVDEAWFMDDYSQGNDISQETRRRSFAAFREFVWNVNSEGKLYFAFGLLDVGLPGVDPSSGLPVVTVTVNAEIFDLSGPFAESVASVGGRKYTAIGRDNDNARIDALQKAARSTSKELTNQLMSQNIR
jgi:hypothetical protein